MSSACLRNESCRNMTAAFVFTPVTACLAAKEKKGNMSTLVDVGYGRPWIDQERPRAALGILRLCQRAA